MSDVSKETQLLVIGGGPGGYPAAIHAADHGLKPILVDEGPKLGGVCTNRGCIPSKALLHLAKLIEEAKEAADWGVSFGQPKFDLAEDPGVRPAEGGRQVDRRHRHVVQGPRRRGHHRHARHLRRCQHGQARRGHDRDDQVPERIIATGSLPAMPKAFALGDPRIMDSTGALLLPDIPKRMLVIGGGYIGLEIGTRLRGARHEDRRRRVHRRPSAHRRPRPGEAAGRPAAEAVRGDLPQHEGGVAAADGQGDRGDARRQGRAGPGDVRPGAGLRRPAAQQRRTWGSTRPGVNVTERGLHPGRQAAADERAAHLRPGRRGRGAGPGPQGDGRGQGGGRDHPRRAGAFEPRAIPGGRLHRPGTRLGRADRAGRGREGRARTRSWCSRGPRPAGRRRSPATTA